MDNINSTFREKLFGDIWKAYTVCPIPISGKPCIVIEAGAIYLGRLVVEQTNINTKWC